MTAVIAKELAKDYDVTILTFDSIDKKDVSLYGLNEVDIHFQFFSYPSVGYFWNKLCKAYSGFYQRYRPESKIASNLYALSSFPYPLRNALIKKLNEGNYDIIVGVHAPLAGRLATMKKKLHGATTIGWIHNSYEGHFC